MTSLLLGASMVCSVRVGIGRFAPCKMEIEAQQQAQAEQQRLHAEEMEAAEEAKRAAEEEKAKAEAIKVVPQS